MLVRKLHCVSPFVLCGGCFLKELFQKMDGHCALQFLWLKLLRNLKKKKNGSMHYDCVQLQSNLTINVLIILQRIREVKKNPH